MSKIQKTKNGFTLIEMILVIAIIVVLASILFISVGGYLSKANTAKVYLESHNADVLSGSKVLDTLVA